MRQVFIYLLLTFFCFPYAQAQRYKRDTYTGINFSTEVNYYGIYINPSITRESKRHTFAIGPVFDIVPYTSIIPKKAGYYYPTEKQFYGGRISYDNRFYSRSENFNLFFNLNLTYHHMVFSEYENYSTKVIEHFENKSEFLGFYFGLGNYFYYKSGVYVNTSVDWGATLYEKLGAPPSFSIPDRGYLSNTMVIRIGVGYFIQ